MLQDVGDGEVVGKDRPDEGERGGGDGQKAGDSGPARGIGQPFRGDAGRLPDGNEPQGQRSSQKVVGGQSQRNEKSKATESCHYDYDSTMILACRWGAGRPPDEVILNPL